MHVVLDDTLSDDDDDLQVQHCQAWSLPPDSRYSLPGDTCANAVQ